MSKSLLLGSLVGAALWAVGGIQSAACAADVPAAVREAEQQRIAAIEKAQQPTVCVFGTDGKGGGSGVLISPDGYALTNFHVVQPCGEHMKCGLSDGRMYDAVIVGNDPTGDVALIRLLGRTDFPVAEMADSDTVRAGDWCFAIGNPFLLATDLQPTVSYGIVSGVHRYQYPAGTLLEYADCIQTDAAINPGNSGGPLFNAQGQLIGVNGRGSFEKRGRVNVGVGYAISINQIKHFLGYLRSGRIVDHATLGATVVSDDQGRVVVSNILDDSDAYRRGLRYGDEILSFGGRRITTVNGFKNALGIYPRDWRVPLSFQRNGERYDVFVRLAGVHSREQLIESVQRAPTPPDPQPTPPGPAPQPMPDQQPAPEQPPMPERQPMARDPHAKAEMPAEVKAQYEARRGYANYYFNKLHRDRVWNAFLAHGDFRAQPGMWRLMGLSADSKVRVEISENLVFARLPDGPARLDLAADLTAQLAAGGNMEVLAALHLWKRFLNLGPDRFGEVYYLGEAPLPNREGLFDVIVAVHDIVETRFYFDPVSGRMVALEMSPDVNTDPCEVYFDDFQTVDGRLVPHRLEVLSGGDLLADIRVSKFELAAEPSEPEESRAP